MIEIQIPTPEKAARLREVFDLVKTRRNWKEPISATVLKSAASRREIREAVVFFCGGYPDVEVSPHNPDMWLVTGAGYYTWVGA